MRYEGRIGVRCAWGLVAVVCLAVPLVLHAGPVVVPQATTSGPADNELNAFEAGKPAKAADVMHNFTVLAKAVNDLDTEVKALRAEVAGLKVNAVFKDVQVESIAFVGGGTLASPQVVGVRTLLDRLPGPSAIRVFRDSGTWTRPTGVRRVWVQVAGAGGGGGNSGEGGGGGGYAAGWIDVQAVSTVPVTVGAGGTGGVHPSTGSPSGGNGGASSFGTYLSAAGGSGGGYQSAFGGPGGEGSGGDLQIPGEQGVSGKQGGHSFLGYGGRGRVDSPGDFARPGTGFGGGGGGSTDVFNNGARGAPGVVIVWEYE